MSDVRTLWQAQPAEGCTLSVDELRSGARRLERRVGRRNLREYVAGVIVVISYGLMAWLAPSPMIRVGAGLVMAATLFIVYHLHQQGSVRIMPADLALVGCVQFHRRELERQRDLLRGVWKWALMPLLPGGVLVMVGGALTKPDPLFWIGVGVAVTFVFFIALGELNRRVANKIQRRIAALEREL